METLVRTTNTVRLSFLRALLADSGIQTEVFDGNISALEPVSGPFRAGSPCRRDSVSRLRPFFGMPGNSTMTDSSQEDRTGNSGRCRSR